MMRARLALLLAIAATSTAVCMSVLAGWQRGGWLPERLVWIVIGVVLVTSAHLLPALCRSAPLALRLVGLLLWLGCMTAASYGHATFFLLSQSHAGEARVTSASTVPVAAHRDLVSVMTDRAAVTAELAQANARHCTQMCPSLQVRRISLAAQLEAIDAEAAEVRRDQAIEDRNAARQDTVQADPVTSRLATLFRVASTQLGLFAGLAFAAVLEGLACLLWSIALLPQHPLIKKQQAASAFRSGTPPPAVRRSQKLKGDIEQLRHDIAAGLVKPTVVGIRQYLRCSQAKAAALRKQLQPS